MKRLVVLIAVALILAFTYPAAELTDGFKEYDGLKVTFYVDEAQELSYGMTLRSGIGYAVTVLAEDAAKARRDLSGVNGESVEIPGNASDAAKVLDYFGAEMVFEQEIDGVTYIYAYSRRMKYLTESEGQKINIQIAIRENIVIIGTPLILGGC